MKKKFLPYFLLLLGLSSSISADPFFNTTFAASAIANNDSIYQEGEDYIHFWEKQAGEIDWFVNWEKPLLWNKPYAKWFIGGKTNISFNCLDRHILNGKGQKIAFYYHNEKGQKTEITYQQLYEEVNKLANALKKLNIKKGDKVAIYMPMTKEGIASMLACTRVGAVHTVIFGGIGAKSVKDRIEDAEAKCLIAADGSFRNGKYIPYKSKIDSILNECSTLENVIVFNHCNLPHEFIKGRDHDYHELLSSVDEYCPPELMDSEDMSFILYTSGTTGKPKGIFHTTGGYLVGTYYSYKYVFDHKNKDVFWCTADIGWITGHSYLVYGPLSNGATQVLYEGALIYPHLNQIARIIEEYNVSVFYTAPTLIRMLMKYNTECVSEADISSLRLLGSIGEPINPEAWNWYYKHMGQEKCPIVDTWFQTETGSLVISPLPGITPLKPGSISKALPGYEVDVLDEDGLPSSKGYLAIKKPFPSMMRGLYKDHERYVSTYWSKWNGEYYYAGDAASKDSDGYIWIGGRSDEVLKVAGHRIGTAEIENALVEHPAVSESAVIGIKDPLKGQKILAFVILKNEYEKTSELAKELRNSVANYLGSYARPERVLLVDKLPKTRSGKILRRVIKNMIEGKELGNLTTLSDLSSIDSLIPICEELKLEFFPDENTLDAISQIPEIGGEIPLEQMGSAEIVAKTTPILIENLKNYNYDRLHMCADFLQFHKKIKSQNPTIKPIEALALFQPDLSPYASKGSPCHGLARILQKELSNVVSSSIIPAVLPERFHQKGWANDSHVAVALRFENPIDFDDKGVILFDPSFDIEKPLVLFEDGTPIQKDMKNNGLWEISYDKNSNAITCLGNPKPNQESISAERCKNLKMTYNLIPFENCVEVGIKPMIAMDRKISLVARDIQGNHLGHLNIHLDKEVVSWSVNYERMPQIPFEKFLTESSYFTEEIASLFNLPAEELNNLIVGIISQKEVLDDLRQQYLSLIKHSIRREGFKL
jgi:acetyl-CoA synthetase